MRRNRHKRTHPGRKLAIQISSRDLTMVIVEGADKSEHHVRGYHLPWQQESTSLLGEEGQRELAAALTRLVTKEKLSGSEVHIALSSDFCVTRVLAGGIDKVRSEARSTRERSAHYLWLGAGPKALAESARQVDAKQIQTWLTVTNEKILEKVVQAISQSGLHVGLIEHSMVAACRALGNMEEDSESPVIIVELNQRGVDLGVAYKGQLLFDYRPGGIDIKERIGEIVTRHLDRIQRYCDRHYRFARGTISQVFICGELEDATRVQGQFANSSRLSAEVLDVSRVCPNWDYDLSLAADARFVGPLGSALVEDEQLQRPQDERGLPDLMDYFRKAWREPLMPALSRLCWPVAATLVIAAAIFSAAFLERGKALAIERETEQLDAQLVDALESKRRCTEAMTKTGYLKSIRTHLRNPRLHETIKSIGQCLSEDAWLDEIRIEDSGTVVIRGTARSPADSSSEEVVRCFVQELGESSVLERINLEEQRPTSNGGVTFDIKCELSDYSDSAGKTDSND